MRICSAGYLLKTLIAAAFLTILLTRAFSQESTTSDVAHFDYDASTALGLKELSVQQRDDISIHDITYTSLHGGAVPAYLVVPKGPGKYAAILWGHWLMPNSPTHLGPAPALFQYGVEDEEWVPLKDAKDYFAMSSGPKEAKFYESGHALNAQARVDRVEFLRQHLALLPLSRGTLESIPATK